jgi:RNA polymerase sigma-70 factor, ECF subfamily
MLRLTTPQRSPALSDEALLAVFLQDGANEQLGVLYERYIPMVFGVCLKIFRDKQLAEDAVMGIYEEVNRKIRDHEVGHFRGWLYVLARNYCLMELRRQKRRPTDLHAPETMERYDAVEEAAEFELPTDQPTALNHCLETLQHWQQQCVKWFYFDDKSYKEIAELIQEEVGKVRSYIQNGRRNLRLCMEKYER